VPDSRLGGSLHDPTDPVGRLLFNVLAMVAEFESDLIRMRTREGMKAGHSTCGEFWSDTGIGRSGRYGTDR
jgi:DNA invertase Pin-like site-specific DNA recombinase